MNRMLNNQNGSAMVISLLTLILLSMAGTLFIARTKTETQIAGHDMRSTQALYNAEAGYAEVLARMSDDKDVDNYIGQAMGGWLVAPGWGTYVVNNKGASTDDPDYSATATDGLDNDGDGQIDESGEAYPEINSKQAGTAEDINYPWVSVRYKLDGANQVMMFGDHDADITTAPKPNSIRGFPMIVVTANGGQGSSNRTVEVEAVKVPFEVVQTAMYSESDDFQFNGTQFLVSGQDYDPVTGAPVAGNPEVPGILTTGDPDAINGSLNAQQQNNVEGEGLEPSTVSSPVDMDMDAMYAAYTPLAEYVVPTGTYDSITWGDYDNYTVVHCTGNLHLSGGVSGGGICIVNGNLTVSGTFTWYGLMLVMGDIKFTGGGSGIHLYGATMVKGGGPGNSVSGNADIFYSSEALSRLAALSPYSVYNWREVN